MLYTFENGASITHCILLTVAYLLGIQNMIANALSSQRFATYYKWELHDSAITDIFGPCGTPVRDLFATQNNTKCTQYCSRGGVGTQSEGDTLVLNWLCQTDELCLPPTRIRWERVRIIL